MSEFFIYQFNRETGCAHCKTSALVVGKRTYSLCRIHLTAARDRWRVWAAERRAAGACISCHRKSFNGWLRCRKHREENRLRIAAWVKEHPEHSARQWAKRKQLIAAGFCGTCKDHRRLETGRSKCSPCLARARVHGRASYARNSL